MLCSTRTVSLAVVGVTVAMLGLPVGGAKHANASDLQCTVAYVANVATEIERADPEKNIDPLAALRTAAGRIRQIRWDGVETRAVQLAWKTANLFDRTASLGERYQEAIGAGLIGGISGGQILVEASQNDDPIMAIIGLGIMGMSMLGADDAVSRLQAEAAALQKEAEALDSEWETYVRGLLAHYS